MKNQRYRPFLMALLTAGSMTIGAKINFEFGMVPMTLQTFFLCLTALFFRPQEVLFGQLIYLVAGLFSPVFSSDYYGMDVLLGNSAGYLFAFPAAAWLISRYGKTGDLFATVSWCAIGHALVLLSGYVVLVLVHHTEQDKAVHDGLLNLLPGALVKSLAAALIYWGAERFLRKKDK